MSSIPSFRYRAVVALSRLVPPGVLGGLSSKAGRQYHID